MRPDRAESALPDSRARIVPRPLHQGRRSPTRFPGSASAPGRRSRRRPRRPAARQGSPKPPTPAATPAPQAQAVRARVHRGRRCGWSRGGYCRDQDSFPQTSYETDRSPKSRVRSVTCPPLPRHIACAGLMAPPPVRRSRCSSSCCCLCPCSRLCSLSSRSCVSATGSPPPGPRASRRPSRSPPPPSSRPFSSCLRLPLRATAPGALRTRRGASSETCRTPAAPRAASPRHETCARPGRTPPGRMPRRRPRAGRRP